MSDNFLAAEVIHITELAKRVRTSEDAAMALDVAQQYALRRANRQQHDGIHPHVSYLILKASPLQVSRDQLILDEQPLGRMVQSEPHRKAVAASLR